jgi:hypothetical protein
LGMVCGQPSAQFCAGLDLDLGKLFHDFCAFKP